MCRTQIHKHIIYINRYITNTRLTHTTHPFARGFEGWPSVQPPKRISGCKRCVLAFGTHNRPLTMMMCWSDLCVDFNRAQRWLYLHAPVSLGQYEIILNQSQTKRWFGECTRAVNIEWRTIDIWMWPPRVSFPHSASKRTRKKENSQTH